MSRDLVSVSTGTLCYQSPKQLGSIAQEQEKRKHKNKGYNGDIK